MKEQSQVLEWMIKADQSAPCKPTAIDPMIAQLRYDLIKEELLELGIAANLTEVADAIGDLLYVVLGTAVAYGIDIDPIFQEIHRSNMSKFIDGYKRADGKWMKGPSYSPANLKPIIDVQCK